MEGWAGHPIEFRTRPQAGEAREMNRLVDIAVVGARTSVSCLRSWEGEQYLTVCSSAPAGCSPFSSSGKRGRGINRAVSSHRTGLAPRSSLFNTSEREFERVRDNPMRIALSYVSVPVDNLGVNVGAGLEDTENSMLPEMGPGDIRELCVWLLWFQRFSVPAAVRTWCRVNGCGRQRLHGESKGGDIPTCRVIVYGNMDSCIFTSDMGRDWNCVSLAPDVSARVSDTFLPPVGPESADASPLVIHGRPEIWTLLATTMRHLLRDRQSDLIVGPGIGESEVSQYCKVTSFPFFFF
eukprot:Gb_07151 [translate_table: standard]